MATTFMNLSLPTPTVTLGPEWANALNTAIETIDAHDHTSDKGARIPTAGLNINGNLDFNQYKIFNFKQTQYANNTILVDGADNAGSVYMKDGNLYFTNSSGIAVQITSGGAIVSSPGAAQTFEVTDVSSNLSILNTDTFVFLRVDTTASRTITLPLANSVSSGRIYIIKDISGQAYTNPITVNVSGADTIDGQSSIVVNSDFGSAMIVSNGLTAWNVG